MLRAWYICGGGRCVVGGGQLEQVEQIWLLPWAPFAEI